MTRVHFIGIGGSGLSAIARLLKESGYQVTGSDKTLTPFAADLQAAGVTVYVGHHPRNVSGSDWVVKSSAISDDNPEVRAALQAGIPVYKRSDFLDKIFLHPVFGLVSLAVMMFVVFQAVFAWAAPFMDGIESLFGWLGEVIGENISHPLLNSLKTFGPMVTAGSLPGLKVKPASSDTSPRTFSAGRWLTRR